MTAQLIMSIAFLAYVIPTMLTGKMDESISASFYNWQGWKRIFFILMTWGISLPIFWLLKDPWTDWNYVLVGSAMSMIIVGTYAAFRESKGEEIFHVVGSYLAIILGLAGVWILYGYWIATPVFLITMAVIQFTSIKNKTWWIEVAAFIGVWFGLLKV